MQFDELGLADPILRAIAREGYTRPTPIQEQAIPAVLNGHDVLAAAQTGTGKTAGFTLPILQLLSEEPLLTMPGNEEEGPGRRSGQRKKKSGGRSNSQTQRSDAPARRSNGPARPPRALILTPTRELAAQIGDNITAYGHFVKLRSAVVFGGVNINPQINMLARGVDILVATPGRLLDLHRQGKIDFSHLRILVLDEADRMLDMGFIHDIRRILKLLPVGRQNLLFSATFSPEIKKLIEGLLRNPVKIDVTPKQTAAETVEQRVYSVDKNQKPALLARLIHDGDWQQVLVFTRTKHGANRLAEKLEREGIRSAAIHGNKSQGARTRALADFKQGDLRALVATDIAARGLDIEQLPQVVNFELPNVPEDYVHRIGRTGRAGAAGNAVSLVSAEEIQLLRGIENLLRVRLPANILPGFEPRETAPVPAEVGTGGRGQASPGNNRFETPARSGGNGRSGSNGRSGGGRSGADGGARSPRRRSARGRGPR